MGSCLGAVCAGGAFLIGVGGLNLLNRNHHNHWYQSGGTKDKTIEGGLDHGVVIHLRATPIGTLGAVKELR